MYLWAKKTLKDPSLVEPPTNQGMSNNGGLCLQELS